MYSNKHLHLLLYQNSSLPLFLEPLTDSKHCVLVGRLSVITLHSVFLIRSCTLSHTPSHSRDQSEVSALGVCSRLKDMGCFMGCSKSRPSFPNLSEEIYVLKNKHSFQSLVKKNKTLKLRIRAQFSNQ